MNAESRNKAANRMAAHHLMDATTHAAQAQAFLVDVANVGGGWTFVKSARGSIELAMRDLKAADEALQAIQEEEENKIQQGGKQ